MSTKRTNSKSYSDFRAQKAQKYYKTFFVFEYFYSIFYLQIFLTCINCCHSNPKSDITVFYNKKINIGQKEMKTYTCISGYNNAILQALSLKMVFKIKRLINVSIFLLLFFFFQNVKSPDHDMTIFFFLCSFL